VVQLLAQNWWALGLRGAFAVIFGVLALVLPGITLGALILLFGAYAVADGVLAIISGARAAHRGKRRGAFILEGIVGIIAGLVAFFAPLTAALAFIYLFAAWALVTGALEIAAAIRLRREIEDEWLLGLTGVLSVLLGVFVAIFPGLGLVGLIWSIGAYTVAIGVIMIVLAFRLRRLWLAEPRPAHP
jgi:uncharacterized membrane protein HdeD (DUF308 family)